MVKTVFAGVLAVLMAAAGARAEGSSPVLGGDAAGTPPSQTAKTRVKARPKPKPSAAARGDGANGAGEKLDKAALRAARLARIKPAVGGIVRLGIRDPLAPLGPTSSPAERAFRAMTKARWGEAMAAFRKVKDPLVRKTLVWYRLQSRTSGASFAQIARFMRRNPHWPLQARLIYRAERAMGWGARDRAVLAFFKDKKPRTIVGAMRLAQALRRAGKEKPAVALIKATWQRGRTYGRQEKQFIQKFGADLSADDYAARAHFMLYHRKFRSARRYITANKAQFGPDQVALFKLRMQLLRRWRTPKTKVAAMLEKVPEKLRGHQALQHDLIRWHRRQGRLDEAWKLLKAIPASAEPRKKWWHERAWLARVSLRAGRARLAYAVARSHGLKEPRLRYEGEWLAGWIALRFVKSPRLARPHLAGLYERAQWPVSKARGAYWLGRTAEAARDRKAALKWYRLAATHVSTFYGQFALAKLGRREFTLPRGTAITAADRVAFERTELVRAARRLHALKQRQIVRWFVFAAYRNAKTPAARALASALGVELGRLEAAVRTAKYAGKHGQLFVESGYPVIEVPAEIGPEPALVLSLIRQESEFNYEVVSWAGARGLMQLMPRTARSTARSIKARYNYRALTRDPDYNMKIGSAHLKELIDKFDGNYVLVMAAYNAGAGAVKFWLRVNGDPRGRSNERMIDWIEAIPVDETRNYVQRVMESLQVYRARLGQRALAARRVATAWRGKAVPIIAGGGLDTNKLKPCLKAAAAGTKGKRC